MTKTLKTLKTLKIYSLAFCLTLMAGSNVANARTYIVNGIASAVPFIGYGMNNLGKRIPGAKVFSYVTSLEGNGYIKPNIIKDIVNRYKKNPNEKVNLIGISYGANMVSDIAGQLSQAGIPINYLGIIEGSTSGNIRSNVRKAHNFTCNGPECTKKKVRLKGGNTSTQLDQFSYSDGHINLGNNKQVHTHILNGIR